MNVTIQQSGRRETPGPGTYVSICTGSRIVFLWSVLTSFRLTQQTESRPRTEAEYSGLLMNLVRPTCIKITPKFHLLPRGYLFIKPVDTDVIMYVLLLQSIGDISSILPYC